MMAGGLIDGGVHGVYLRNPRGTVISSPHFRLAAQHRHHRVLAQLVVIDRLAERLRGRRGVKKSSKKNGRNSEVPAKFEQGGFTSGRRKGPKTLFPGTSPGNLYRRYRSPETFRGA
jgi:hypothetical protein